MSWQNWDFGQAKARQRVFMFLPAVLIRGEMDQYRSKNSENHYLACTWFYC